MAGISVSQFPHKNFARLFSGAGVAFGISPNNTASYFGGAKGNRTLIKSLPVIYSPVEL
jgi:hypothetical protein